MRRTTQFFAPALLALVLTSPLSAQLFVENADITTADMFTIQGGAGRTFADDGIVDRFGYGLARVGLARGIEARVLPPTYQREAVGRAGFLDAAFGLKVALPLPVTSALSVETEIPTGSMAFRGTHVAPRALLHVSGTVLDGMTWASTAGRNFGPSAAWTVGLGTGVPLGGPMGAFVDALGSYDVAWGGSLSAGMTYSLGSLALAGWVGHDLGPNAAPFFGFGFFRAWKR